MKNYYGLVASMPDVSPDDAKLNFTVADFKEDYWPQLSETDKKLVALFLALRPSQLVGMVGRRRRGGV